MKKLFSSPYKTFSGLIKISFETWLVIFLLLVAGLAHSSNMFNYPYFENDEGTYLSQAWSFIDQGKLSPYTYYYDHAPAGWMLLGAWLGLTGGLETFGPNPLHSGRVFIFVLHLVSVFLLYVITKRITRQKLAASIAVIVFSLSPLELYYGRRILLDNIMVFWMLWSLYFATVTPQKLRHVVMSGIAFALATLTKENAIFSGPVILYISAMHANPSIWKWTIGKWLVTVGVLLSLYPLYAWMKGELLPASFWGDGRDQVSLIETLQQQASRGKGLMPWAEDSDFYSNFRVWLARDPWIILLGSIALLTSMILNDKYKAIKAISLTAIAQILFLARGQLVFDFYIIGVLPFFAILIGSMAARPVIWAKDHISVQGYACTSVFLIALMFVTSGTPAFTVNETINQQKAIDWVVQNVSKDAKISVNNYAYPQLRGVEGFENAELSFKIEFDPEIRRGVFHEDPYTIEYMLVTHSEIYHFSEGYLPFLSKTFDHSQLVADYRKNTTSYIDISKLISTNGDWAQVYKLDPNKNNLLVDSWRSYKRHFIKDDGQVIDKSNWTTTSEGQSYALLQALEHNDQVAFDSVWSWTKEHMQVRETDSLFVWKMQLDEHGKNHIFDSNSLSYSDQNIAFALYGAYLQWGNESYKEDAKIIIADIWSHEVIERNNRLYLLAFPDGQPGSKLLVNPSHLSPYYYRYFAKIDENDWNRLITDSYSLLTEVQERSTEGIIPNWIAVEQNGSLSSAQSVVPAGADSYSYDAYRVAWRMSQDAQDPRAGLILQSLGLFYEQKWLDDGFISTEYSLEGRTLSDYADIPTTSGAVIALQSTSPELAQEVFQDAILSRYNEDDYSWGKRDSASSQNWAVLSLSALGYSPTTSGITLSAPVSN
ncbi:MAG: glycosyl hydrolase family 8 [Patescibacteria group bacterium]